MTDGIIELHLNSRDGIEQTQDNEKGLINFRLTRSIAIPNRWVEIALVGGKIPRTFYIIDAINCHFDITIDATVYSLQLTHGNPNAHQVVLDMINLINNATGKTFTGTYSTTTNKYTLGLVQTTEAAVSLSFPNDSKIYRVFGFTNAIQPFTLSAGSFTLVSNLVGTLSSIPSCSIHLEGYTFDDALTTSGHSDILHRQYFRSAPNGYEVMDSTGHLDWKTTYVASGHITSLLIGMKDSDKRVIDFNGVDWELTLYVKPRPVKE